VPYRLTLPELLKRVEELHEFNPMLGLPGCRLGILYPEITEMRARAIFEAVVQVANTGVKVIPEVMNPLTGGFKKVGTMIEIPRTALSADQVATEAEFFSYGTNDLTQTAMGLSRDDYVKFSKAYEDLKILKAGLFAVLDQEGVGKLVEMGVKLGRQTRPNLEIGICGEHGGEPRSVEFCYRVGMNYVSCPPYRVPIARLAAAQAAISGDKTETMRTA